MTSKKPEPELQPDLLVPEIYADLVAESIERERLRAQELADAEFEQLARELKAREAARKKLWGDKYPPVYTETLRSPKEMKKYLSKHRREFIPTRSR